MVALRERLRERNGLRGLEVVSPDEVTRAAELFHRDGFVAVRDAIQPDQLERIRTAAAEVIETLVAADPDGAVGGGAGGLPHRYSFGGTSASRHMFHRPEWRELIDMPTTTPILTEIFGSPNYIVYGGGGDIALPGAIEYQGLHSDNVWTELHDPIGGVTMRDLPVPVVHINFPLVDLTTENGPIRQIPGSHRSRAPIPRLADEPEWMRLSTVCPLAGGFGDLPRRSLLARWDSEPVARSAGHAERRVLRALVPQRGVDPINVVRPLADVVAARPTDLQVCGVRPGRGRRGRGVQPSTHAPNASAIARPNSRRWASTPPATYLRRT